jgi:Secretion system C-terminal sorting domain
MKRALLLAAILSVTAVIKLQAQCTASNLNIVIKNVTSSASGCQVTLDLSFTGDFNNGNKYAFIHLWETAPVNNYPNLTYSNPPTAAELSNAVATIAIADPGKNSAALYNQYPPNSAVPVKYSGVGFSKSGNVYSMTNVVINFSTCNVPVTVKGDVWASQSDFAQVVHCESDGIITILFNNPVITGAKQCASPRLLNLSFKNEHPTLSESVVANVFIDNNSNGLIDAGDIDITNVLSPALPNPMYLAANSILAYTGLSYLPYSSEAQYHNKPVIVRANATAPGAATVTITKNDINYLGSCTLLPVNFQSFTVSRNNSRVLLKWETASEQNNSGFVVERNASGTWQQATSVPSKAAGGNSNSILSYSYEDMNSGKSITQYRIKQVDFDGMSTYSEIKIVAGAEQLGKITVYPNPSNDGKVNVVLESAGGPKDISIMDIAGRVIKQWNGITSANMQIGNLLPGMYNLRVIARETGKQSIEKIMISRR